ncbi:MAG: pilin, partial [Candidatus Nomurabacteria bacterium]|nr:pilin [Candidatus Nomurabacteria bacterium]
MKKILTSFMVAIGLFGMVGIFTPAQAFAVPDCTSKPYSDANCPCYKYHPNNPGYNQATPRPSICPDPASFSNPSDSISDDEADDEANALVTTIINWLMWGVGVLGVIMIIVSGITYVTAQGSPDKAKKAKSMLIYSIVGLIFAMLALVIINFVIKTVGG